MKLDKAKHILKESGCLLERQNDIRYYTNAEFKDFISKVEKIGVDIYKSGWQHIFCHPDTRVVFGKAEKHANNSWRVDIYDMEFSRRNFSLVPKDYYGPVSLDDGDVDEMVEILEKYNDCESYLNAIKNKTAKEVEIKFNI